MTVDVLITGANGQLGWELSQRSERRGRTTRAFASTALNITDADSVSRTVEALSPKAVINAAAYTAVDKAETEPAAAFAINRDGPANLAAVCAAHNIPLIHISTDYVFDGEKPGAYSEEDPVAPLGVYGASKLAGEDAIRDTVTNYAIIRTAWVYGVHGHNFVKTMLRLAEKQDSLRVVNDQFGCPTFAADLADAILEISDRLVREDVPADGLGTFHCSGSGRTTWCEFARKIFELASPTLGTVPTVDGITTEEYPTPARRPANSVLDCSKLSRTYGITLRSWQSALADMLHITLSGDTHAAKEMR